MNTPEQVRYILYARKSSESEDKQMASLNDQIEVMKKLAKDRGLHIHDVIQEARSAKEPGRPGFQELLTRIQNGEADGVLTWKLNRLARNPVDGGQISWLLQRGVIRHIQTFEGVYKPTDNVILMQVEFGMANQYVNNLRTDVKRGTLRKAKRGWFPSPILPFGYMHNKNYHDDKNGEIITHPEHFPIMKSLWKKLLSGKYSVPMILKEVDQLNIANQKGRPFSRSTLYRYFSNPFYYGEFTWKNEGGEKEIFKGKHKPMISQEEFLLAQKIIGDRAHPHPSSPYNHPYCEVFHCGECGCSITAEQKVQAICSSCKKKFSIKNTSVCGACETHLEDMESPKILTYTYYRCTKKRGKCSQRYLSSKEMESQILEHLAKIALPEPIVTILRDVIDEEREWKDDDRVKVSPQKLKHRLTELQEKKSRLIDLRTEGEISREDYLKKASEISELINSLEEAINSSKEMVEEWKFEAHHSLNISQNAVEIFQKGTNDEKRTLLTGLGSNLILKDRELDFSTHFLLLDFRRMVEGVFPDVPWLEPKRMAQLSHYSDEIGLSKGRRLILLAEMDAARTLWTQKKRFKINTKLRPRYSKVEIFSKQNH